MPDMKFNTIPWGDPILTPVTSLSRQQGSKQAQRLYPLSRVSRNVLCREYARTKNCAYGTSCKYFHHPSISIPSDQRTENGRHVWICYNYIHGVCCRQSCTFIHPEDPDSFMKYTPCRLGRRCTRELCSFYHSDRYSFPPAPQLDTRHPMMKQGISDPPLSSDTGIARENEDCVSIGGNLASNLPPSLEGHTTSATGAHLFKGASRRRPRRPLASIRPLSNPHLPLSFLRFGLMDVLSLFGSEAPLVQSPREISVPSGLSRFRSSDSQCYPIKDLVDELTPFPFVHSPFINPQRVVGRSVEYEDLLKDTKEKSPLCRRRMSWSGFELSGSNEE